ncbi:MFS transporter [Burkholderia gladioli]|nr:MFS transporter [Burkholderia gladioli]MBW5285051.1 MFS transporter [Burkholderia gladioli]
MTLPMLILYAIGALGPYLVRDLDIPVRWLGYVTTSTFAVAALLSLGAGPVTERLGARRALLLLFCSVALAYAAIVSTRSFAGIVAAAAICGIAQALSNPVTNLLIAQRVAPARKAFVVGLKQAGVQLGALFAGLVFPPLAAACGWRTTLVLSAIAALLVAAASTRIVAAGATRPPRPFALARPNGLLLRLMGIQGCAGVVLSAFVTFLPVFATHRGLPPAEAGALVALFGAMGIVSRLVLTPLGARLRDESILLAVLFAIAALAILLAVADGGATPARLWSGAALIGLSAVATNAVAMSMVVRDPSFGGAASASGLLSAGFFAGFAVGPTALGLLAGTRLGLAGAFALPGGAALLGAIASIVLRQARRAVAV